MELNSFDVAFTASLITTLPLNYIYIPTKKTQGRYLKKLYYYSECITYNVGDFEEVRLSGEKKVDVGRVKVERMTAQRADNSLSFCSYGIV